MIRSLKIFILLAALSASAYASAGDILVVGLRGHDHETEAFIAEHHLAPLPSFTKEYTNRTTFARFEKDVTNQEVIILLPQELTPNLLMEACLKIKTAHDSLAKTIAVHVEGGLIGAVRVLNSKGKSIDVNLERLFSVSGMDFLSDAGGIHEAKPVTSHKREFNQGETLIYGPTHQKLTDEIAKSLNAQMITSLNDLSDLKSKQIIYVAANQESPNETLFEAMAEIELLKARGATVHLVMPYYPYARSDKRDDAAGMIGGRAVANLIESSGIDSVTFMRLHSPQGQGYFNVPSLHLSGRDTLEKYIKELHPDLLGGGDVSALKDVKKYGKELGLPFIVVDKDRDPMTTQVSLTGLLGPNPKGKTVILIDDELDTGGTLAQAAEALKKEGASRVIVIVNFITGTGQKALDCKDIDQIITLNTLPHNIKHPKIVELSSGEEIANGIRSLQTRAADVVCKAFLRDLTPEASVSEPL